jgi:hypothetical protein
VAVEIQVAGAEQLRALGRDLKAAGSDGEGLRRELLAGMRALGKPLVDKARQSAIETLPKSGGLNQWVADSKISVRNNLTGSGGANTRVGLKIVSIKGVHSMVGIDNGHLRHPVYNNRKNWVSQSVPEGWFSKPLAEAQPEVLAMLSVTMNVISRRIERG